MDSDSAPADNRGATSTHDAAAIDALKREIRQIAHDMSNPLGTLRMALYYLETAKPDESKRAEYYALISRNIDRIESKIRDLRILAGSPSVMNDKDGPSL